MNSGRVRSDDRASRGKDIGLLKPEATGKTIACPVGYRHPKYARSLSALGSPLSLERSGGWILRRPIAGADSVDAVGCYPLFTCCDWSELPADLADLDGIVSLTAVADPFGDYDVALLRRSFPDLVRPFKQHLVRDMALQDVTVSRHHAYYARRARRFVQVEECPEPAELAADFAALYRNLTARRQLTGIHAFSGETLAQHLQTPGMIAFRASRGGATVAAHLWFVDGDVAYSHLSAQADAGYEVRASYALNWHAIDHFRGSVRWLDFGGGAGLTDNSSSGLVHFKRGWATGTKTAYLCGRIFDSSAYRELSAAAGEGSRADYFPAYRSSAASP